jgi:hypothetical protein
LASRGWLRWRPTSMPADLVLAHGKSGWTARMVPLTVDGLIYASSMVMLDSARRRTPVPALARWLLGLGIAATLAANVAHGLGHGLMGAAVAAWPAVALVGSYELLMMVIRSSQVPVDGALETEHDADLLHEQAAELFDGATRGRPGSLGPCSAPCRPAPGTKAAQVSRHGSCKTGGKPRHLSNLRGRVEPATESRRWTAARK